MVRNNLHFPRKGQVEGREVASLFLASEWFGTPSTLGVPRHLVAETLLQGHEDLNQASTFMPRLKCFSYYRAEHARPVCSLHGMSWD